MRAAYVLLLLSACSGPAADPAPTDPPVWRACLADDAPRAVSITARGDHGCALMSDGTVRCWGNNREAEVSRDEPLDGGAGPISVRGVRCAAAVAAGDVFTCVLDGAARVRCWGENDENQLGGEPDSFGLSTVPTPASQIVAAAGRSAGAVDLKGGLLVWGDWKNTRLSKPTLVANIPPARSLDLDWDSGCIVDENATAYCFGLDGATTGISTDIHQVPVPSVSALASKQGTTCALTELGQVYCWGKNGEGQLGEGGPVAWSAPVRITGVNDAQSLCVGFEHVCAAVTSPPGVLCWGGNAYGELGDGTFEDHSAPAPVVGLPEDVVQVACGFGWTCALDGDGQVWCWGSNTDGQLGAKTKDLFSTVPVHVDL